LEFIEVKDLVKIYKKGDQEIPAVNHMSFSVREGELLSIVGRSGSGKSTLLNLIGGLDTPDSGSLYFEGKDIAGLSREELAMHRRYRVGMIFQSFNLIYTRNAYENVVLALIFGGVPRNERRKKTVQLLQNVGLGGRIYHKPDELSGGETQRVAIARALANDPKIILADEPTGNLDSQTAAEIIELLKKLNKEQGKTILMITHDQPMAEKISDRLFRLLDGRIIEEKKLTAYNEIR
jgi:putative ABC transport system ATP-binding protein